MFSRILVPTDLTERTPNALNVAAGIGTGAEAHVTLLHVIETIPGADFKELSHFYRELEERARRQLDAFVAGARNLRGRIDVGIVYGKRVEEVLRFATDNDIDLIVLASHPVNPSQPYEGMGTMSYKLSILARCAVLLVK